MITAISAWSTFPNTKKTKDKKKIVYPSIPSSIAPVNHGTELPIPQPPTTHSISSTSSEDDDADFEVDTNCSSKDPHFPNQDELDDLSRDLGLTKAKAEILSSRLKEWEYACSFMQAIQAKKMACDLCKFLYNVLGFESSFTLLLY